MGSDPGEALTERITNAVDAVIERKVEETGIEPDTPREAVQELFGIPEGGLEELSNQEVRELAENIVVRMKESGVEDESLPTIEIRDQGIGQQPDDFPTTFAGLHEDNKITTHYLIGKYGQGGSNTFDFAKYSIILSRSADGGDIGWTIVYFDERLDEEEEYKEGVFKYVTMPDGSIPRIDGDAVSDWTGSLVRLIEYQATGFERQLGPWKSIYQLGTKALFGSIFPFLVEDHRLERYDWDDIEDRPVRGSRSRLNTSSLVDETRKFKEVDLGELGSVKINCWIIYKKGMSRTDLRRKIDEFGKSTEPIVFTLSGQVHNREDKRFFEKTGFSYLKDRIIIEIDCENLSRKGSRIFSSTRNTSSNRDEYREIKEKILKTLDNDEELERINEEYRRRILNEQTDDESEEISQELAKLLQTFTQDDDGNQGTGTNGGNPGPSPGPGPGPKPKPKPVNNLKDTPTYVKITNSADPLKAKQGRRMRVKVEVDAVDEFESDGRGEILIGFGDMDDVLTFSSVTQLKDGRKTFQVEVDEDAELERTGEVTVVAEWDNGRLTTARDVEIVEPPKRQRGGRQSPEGPQTIPVSEDDDETIDTLGWDESNVAEYRPSDSGPGEVYVSLFNQNVKPILEKVEGGDRVLTRYRKQYVMYMAYLEVLRKQDETDTEDTASEEYQIREMNRVARVLMQALAKEVDPGDL
ncbi:hypothetical protein HFX_3004 [Haloferax mediterranei ATCC 33500]|nr:hypothetical protein HFX_3004 [Haloferax mediterranei ATCC 33500]